MAAVVWHVTMSLDGFIAGPDDAMDWVFDYFSEGSNTTAGEVIETTGAIIMGRHTYEVEDRYRPGIYGGAWTGPFFVLTREPPAVGKNVGILGANLANSASSVGCSTRSSFTLPQCCSATAFGCSMFPAVYVFGSNRPTSRVRAS
jgi:RibD C-terminal domain